MMDNWEETFKFPEVFDNTILSAWAGCKTKAFWAHFAHLHPNRTSIHLHAGAAYAKALEVYRQALYSPHSETYGDNMASLIPAVRAVMQAFGYDEAYDEYAETTNKSCERLIDALYLYAKTYDKHDYIQPIVDSNGNVMVEKSFTIQLDMKHPVTGNPILFHGRTDALVTCFGEPFQFDDKTTSQLGPTWVNKWDFRSQFDGYSYGMKQNGFESVGTIVRGHCFLKNEVKFCDAISRRQTWQLDQWLDDVHQMLYEMSMYYERALNEFNSGTIKLNLHTLFPKSGRFNEQCNAYAGCEFKPLCESKFPQRKLNEYRVRVWDPTNPEREDS